MNVTNNRKPETDTTGSALMQVDPMLLQQNRMLEMLCKVHADFAIQKGTRQVFETLLNSTLEITGSEYGFIGEVLKNDKGNPYLHTQAVTNNAWNPEMLQYYNDHLGKEMIFSNLNSLFGEVLKTAAPVISNNPDTDNRRSGLPQGHPILHSFMGLPVIRDQEMIGMIGIANKPGGYQESMADFLQPLLSTYGTLIHAHHIDEQRSLIEKQHHQLMSEMEALITSLDDIVMEMNEQKIFTQVWCNNEEMLFLPKDKLIGRHIREVMGKHTEMSNKLIDKVLETGESQEWDYPDIRENKAYWYSLKITLLKSQGPQGPKRIAIIIKDITARKKADQALIAARKELERANQLLDVSQEIARLGGWEVNPQTQQMFWTRYMYKLREVPLDFPVSIEAGYSFYHPDDQAILREAARKGFSENIPYDLELRHVSAKGKETWVRAIGIPMFQDGKLTHYRGVIMDITEQKLSQLELIQAKEVAEKAAKARSGFLSTMSHEIRTPLNAIIGITNILQEQHMPENAKLVQNLQFSAQHLMSLINDILDFSKMDAGKMELEHQPFDLPKLLHSIANNHQPSANNKNIELFTSFDEKLPTIIVGDHVRLAQILNNLLNNAIKFTSKGYVRLDVLLEQLQSDEAVISFAVTDTGEGIDPDIQQKIFELFMQADSATSRKHGGTGLGLAIIKSLIELHNSHIDVISQPGVGTEFRFSLRYDLQETVVQKPAPPFQLPPGLLKNMPVLIVEDNPINVMVIQHHLNKTGAVTTVATNGKEAVKEMGQQHFIGVILDLHMPEMNGYETIPYIRALLPEAFIIVITADIMPEVTEKLAALQVRHVMQKPFKPDVLYKTLQIVLQEQQAKH
ncbi:ATP-binding protein [Chitinophaga defluvii]|uniref:histidine kinase n=1 Tax=Chitinophaga defluvii TaxID=3163343 RepID=A0ABV2T508_9BACT